MRTIQDTKGDKWVVRFTGGTALRLRDELGIDIDNLISGDEREVMKLFADQKTIFDIMGVVFEAQIERLALVADRTRETADGVETYRALSAEFYERFNGETLDDFVVELLWAVSDSLPNLKRRALRQVLAKLSPAIEKAADEMEKAIEAKIEKQLTEGPA